MEQRQAQPAIHQLRIVVCGSSTFTDQALAFDLFDSVQRMLENMSNGAMRVGTVISGSFDGIDRLARMWAEQRGVAHEAMIWEQAQSVSHSFFDREMPPTVAMKHPAFGECAERLKKARVDAMAVFPNKEGRLGCTAQNLKMVAGHLGIDTFSTDEIVGKIQQNMDRRAGHDVQAQQAALVDSAARSKPRPRF